MFYIFNVFLLYFIVFLCTILKRTLTPVALSYLLKLSLTFLHIKKYAIFISYTPIVFSPNSYKAQFIMSMSNIFFSIKYLTIISLFSRRQRISCTFKKFYAVIYIKFKCDTKSNDRCLFRMVCRIITDF